MPCHVIGWKLKKFRGRFLYAFYFVPNRRVDNFTMVSKLIRKKAQNKEIDVSKTGVN